VIRGTLKTIGQLVKDADIKGAALIYLGEFLNQKETENSHLYSNDYSIGKRYEPTSDRKPVVIDSIKDKQK
jgi:precorrin-4 methylase